MKKQQTKDNFIKRQLDKARKRDLFTWAHRYLRLHNELLVEEVYKKVYDYCRNNLITLLKKDIKNNKLEDSKLGEIVDTIADLFNKENIEKVNKNKFLVEEVYKLFVEEEL
ncbi:MAG: hypothetical protein IKC71_03725 [Clostridia bacterium]|nr:hypothetical protein [Clostridia bacterium]